jgi:hypothetical protein
MDDYEEETRQINNDDDNDDDEEEDNGSLLRNKLAEIGGERINKSNVLNENPLEIEINQYLKDPTPRKSLLKYWHKKQINYPILSQLARSIFCIPATSSPSERAFSLSGLLITSVRSCLKETSVKYCLFLQANKKFAKMFLEEFSSKDVQASLDCEIINEE